MFSAMFLYSNLANSVVTLPSIYTYVNITGRHWFWKIINKRKEIDTLKKAKKLQNSAFCIQCEYRGNKGMKINSTLLSSYFPVERVNENKYILYRVLYFFVPQVECFLVKLLEELKCKVLNL